MFRRLLTNLWLKKRLASLGKTADASFSPGEVAFGPLRETDLQKLWSIEKESFPTPWPISVFQDLMDDPQHGFVAGRIDGRLISYAGYKAMGETAHIVTFCVHPDLRRRGIGRLMMGFLANQLVAKGFVRARLEVRESNLPAQLLYRKLGFKAYRMARGFYADTGEAAILMGRNLVPNRLRATAPLRKNKHGAHARLH